MRNASEINELTPWQELTVGAEIFEPATAKLVKTGEWRTNAPSWREEKCTHCLLCVPYCPDVSIPVKEGKRLDFDFDHCKGCGICYKVCPVSAIEFGREK